MFQNTKFRFLTRVKIQTTETKIKKNKPDGNSKYSLKNCKNKCKCSYFCVGTDQCYSIVGIRNLFLISAHFNHAHSSTITYKPTIRHTETTLRSCGCYVHDKTYRCASSFSVCGENEFRKYGKYVANIYGLGPFVRRGHRSRRAHQIP